MSNNIYQSKYKGQELDQAVNDTATLKDRMGQAEADIQYLNTYKANSNIVPKSIKDLVPDASLIYIGKEEPIGDYTVWIYPVDDTYATMKTKINDVWTNVTIEDLQAEKERINKLKYYGDPDIIISPEEWFRFQDDEHTILKGFSAGHSNETDIVIPYSVTSINFTAFSSCSSLTSITIPNSVTSIGSHAFVRCSSLTSITIPNGVTSVGEATFRGCSSLTSITIPNSVTGVDDMAFDSCSSLTSITIPNSVTRIGAYAFDNCSNLTSITIPNSVTRISDYAFDSCRRLTSITIPNSVTSIGVRVFEGCGNVIICCSQGSYAETYAKENNIPVKYTDISVDDTITEHSENAVSSGAVYSACDSFDASIREVKQIAQSVRDDADNGVFKGDKGDKGDKGEDGHITEEDKTEIIDEISQSIKMTAYIENKILVIKNGG